MDEFSDDFARQGSSHYSGISPMLGQPDDDDDRFDQFNGLETDPDGNKLDLTMGSAVMDDLDVQMREPRPSFIRNGILNNSQDDLDITFGLDMDRDDFGRTALDLSSNDSITMPVNVASTYESLNSNILLPSKTMEYTFSSRSEYIDVATSSAAMAPTDFLAVDESYIDTGEGETSMLTGSSAHMYSDYVQPHTSASHASFYTAISETPAQTAIAPVGLHSNVRTIPSTFTGIQESSTSSFALLRSAELVGITETPIQFQQPPRCVTPTGVLPNSKRLDVLEPGPEDDKAAWNAKILSKMVQPKLQIFLDPEVYKKLKKAHQLPEQIRKAELKRKRKEEKKLRLNDDKKVEQPLPIVEKLKKRRFVISCIVCSNDINPNDSGFASDSLYCSLACIQNMVERCRPCCLSNENITFTNAANELVQLPKKTIVTISTLSVFLQAKPMLKPFVNFAKLQETSKSTPSIKAEKDLKDEDRIRNNVKMNIREQLMNRAKVVKIGVSRIAVTKLAEQIEVELYRLHKYAKAKRYKEWVQDFFAQILKDDNMFFKKVVTNGYTAQKLVLMKKDEMYISPEADTTITKSILVAPKLAPKKLPARPVLSAVDKILGEEGADTTLKHNSHEYDSNCQICAKNTALRRAVLEQAEKDREEEIEERKRRKLLKEKEREERANRSRFTKPSRHDRKFDDDDVYNGVGGGNDDFQSTNPSCSSQVSRWKDFKPVSPRVNESRWDRSHNTFDSGHHNDSDWRRDTSNTPYDRGNSMSPISSTSAPLTAPINPINRPMSPREMTPPPGVSPDRLAVKHVNQRKPTSDFSRDISPNLYQRGFASHAGPSRPMPSTESFFRTPKTGTRWTPGIPEPLNKRSYDDCVPPRHTLESWRREEQWRHESHPGTPPFRPDSFDGPAHNYYNVRSGHSGVVGVFGRPVSPIHRPSSSSRGQLYDYDHRSNVSSSHGHLMYPSGPPMLNTIDRRGPHGSWPDKRRGSMPEFVLEPPVEAHQSARRTPKETLKVSSIWRQDPTIFTGTVSGLTFSFRCTMRAVSNPAVFKLRNRFPNPLTLKARVRPKPMWHFLKSVKHIRRFQTIVATMNITSPMDAEPYFKCFNSLKQSSRYAVFDIPAELGVKEAYMFYLDAGEPLPSILLPVDGPGLPNSSDSKGLLCAVIVKYAEGKRSVGAPVSDFTSPASSMKSHGMVAAQAPVVNSNYMGPKTLPEVLVAIEHILDPDSLIAMVKAFINRGNVTDEEKAILQKECQAKIDRQRRVNSVTRVASPPPAAQYAKVKPSSLSQAVAEVMIEETLRGASTNVNESLSSVAAKSSESTKNDSKSISASNTISDPLSNPPQPLPLELLLKTPASVLVSEPEEGQLREEDAMDISDDEITSSTPMEFVLPPPPPPPSSEALAPPPPPPPPLPAPPFGYEEDPNAPCSGMFNQPVPPRSTFQPPSRPSMGFFNNDSSVFFHNDAPSLHMTEVEGSSRGRGRGRGDRGRGHVSLAGPRGPGLFQNRFPNPSGWQGPSSGHLPSQEDAFILHIGMPSRGPIPLSAIGTRPPRAPRGGRGRERSGGQSRSHF